MLAQFDYATALCILLQGAEAAANEGDEAKQKRLLHTVGRSGYWLGPFENMSNLRAGLIAECKQCGHDELPSEIAALLNWIHVDATTSPSTVEISASWGPALAKCRKLAAGDL